MKQFALLSLRYILKTLARLTIWRFRPGVVGVTGSVGKTSTKLAIAAVLSSDRSVRWSKANLNNDFGLPLTILGDWEEKDLLLVSRSSADGRTAGSPVGAPAQEGERRLGKAIFWLRVILSSAWRVVFGKRDEYPEILVLEYGADRPGDIKYLLTIARPNVSVLTAIGDMPVHVEFFAGPAELAREKARLIECLPVAGYAVLNADDRAVMNLRDRTRAHVTTFGSGKSADVRLSSFENRTLKDGRPEGIVFKLNYGGGMVPIRMEGSFGKGQAYAAAAAAGVGLVFGMNLVRVADALSGYAPAHSRMELLPGLRGSNVIDDSYNASPLAMEAALEALAALRAGRRLAVLGDMLELGRYAEPAHRRAGELAARIVDVLVAVGPRAKHIAEGAAQAGLAKKNILVFPDSSAAKEEVAKLLKKGDLILVKGSRGMHLEEVVRAITQEAGN